MLERTLVFVDTSYLLASFYNAWETGARAQLEIDLPEVVNTMGAMIENQLGQKIQRQYWYDGIPENGPHRYQRALRTCDGVQLRTGQLIEWGDRRTQKGVDTRLVADMIVSAMKQQVTDFVLVSGDADMIPGVEEAVLAGIRVHLYGFGWDSMSSNLRHACDSTTILDPREDFADAMEIQVLEGPLPPVIREQRPDKEDPAAAAPDQDTAADGYAEPAEAEAAFASTPRTAPASPTAAPIQSADATSTDTIAADAAAAAPTQLADAPASAAPAVATAQDSPDETAPGSAPDTRTVSPAESHAQTRADSTDAPESVTDKPRTAGPSGPPKPSMMAPRRKLRSRYVPLPEEVWTSAGFQTPFDVGRQYASWWYENAATTQQRDQAHLLSGGGLPPEVDRPLLQFACETLHEYTLTETQRVNLRDGFHSGIRGVLLNLRD
ncbi:NYN domain-containing protein [Corynebacterium lizhenjunii]|uniref:NYN domain-containing protein n=1 Tax=Corynebacterium lizhenjunii TaxID=2709394 RepID=UPI0013EA2654|nr:NYN domain-containing protein [Corynebacterium lizhenjunii]